RLPRTGHMYDFSAQQRNRLGREVACLLGRAAGGVALDDEELSALRGGAGAIGELAGKAQLAYRALPFDLLLLAAADSLLRALDHEVEKPVCLRRVGPKPEVERVFDGILDDARGLGGSEPVLGLALEFRLADEHRQHCARAIHHVLPGDFGRALALADPLGMILEAPQQRAAQPRFVRPAVGRRNGIAVGGEKAIGVDRPGYRPFGRAMLAGLAGPAGENVRVNEVRAVELDGK